MGTRNENTSTVVDVGSAPDRRAGKRGDIDGQCDRLRRAPQQPPERGSRRVAVADNGLQVFAIRDARPHPWVLSTTRHISQGGVSLLDETWDADANELSGKSAVVVGDPYVRTVHLPEGFRLESAAVGDEKVHFANQKETATVRIVPSATKALEWKVTFAK
jgi:hypothetical protein